MEGSWKAESVSACFKQLSLAGVELPSHSRVSAEIISLQKIFYNFFLHYLEDATFKVC